MVGSGFHIKGDIEPVKNLNHLFEQHQVDWEEHLSKFTGDILAHKAGSIFRKNKSYFKRNQENLIKNIGEYLQEEKEMLPHSLAVKDFSQQLDELKFKVDRLHARLAIVNKRVGKKHDH